MKIVILWVWLRLWKSLMMSLKNSEYRAESYGLIYWSHGDGWIP